MHERKDKPNFLVYLSYFGLFALALNTVYLVLPNDHLKWPLVAILALAVLTGYVINSRHYITIGLLLDIAGLAVFVLYGWKIYQDRMAFGTYLGEMLALMMVLRCFKLFRYQDFLSPLVISLTLMVFTAIPSFSADYVYSLMGFLLMLGLALFLGSVDKFARLPSGKAHTKRWQYTYDFLEEYAPVSISKKNTRQLLKFVGPAFGACIPAVLTGFIIGSACYFTVDHSYSPGSTADFLAAFGGPGFDRTMEEEQDLLTGQTSSSQAQYYTGFDTEFNIARGRLIENSTSRQVVMEVESNLPSYWRGKCFDTYTGRGWHQSDDLATTTWTLEPPKGRWVQFHSVIDQVLENEGIHFDPDPNDEKDEVRQKYFLKASLPGIVFTAYQPKEIEIPVPAVVIDETFTIQSPPSADSMVAGQEYTVTSVKQYEHGDVLRRYDYNLSEFADENPEFYSRYTQLPESGGRSEEENGGVGFDFMRVRAKAFEVTAGADTVYGKVKELQYFLMREYSYSSNPPTAVPPESDAIKYFLFDWEPKRGHCEYFSTSLAVLCRSIGIPSRVVTGYTTGNYNLLKNRYIVQERHAHAWTEVFWPEIGWVEFDPMPVSWYRGFQESAAGSWLLLHNAVENLYVYDPRGFINSKVLPTFGYLYNRAKYSLNQTSLDFEYHVQPILSETGNSKSTPFLMLAGAVFILIGSVFVRQRFDPGRNRKIVLKSGRKSLYRTKKLLVRNGINPHLIATETDCAIQAGLVDENWGDAVGNVVDGYQAAKYSNGKVSVEDVRELNQASRIASKSPF